MLSKKYLFWTVSVCFVLLVLRESRRDKTPEGTLTRVHLQVLKKRILSLPHRNDHLEVKLDEVPYLDGYSNSNKDEWGRDFIVNIEGSKITVSSYGKNGIYGPIDNNDDIFGVFEYKDKEGNWSDINSSWIKEP